MRIICIRPIIDWSCFTRAATTSPNAVTMKPSSSISTNSVASMTGLYGTPTSGASVRTIVPWKAATVAPPMHLPIMIELRRTGATNISRRNPNSRSHTIDTAENIAMKSTASAITPGNMKVLRLTSPVWPSVSDDRPVPRTNMNRIG